MFERFTERARQVVVLAQEEARALKHDCIGTEHILLGLLRVEDGLAARTLESLGVGIESVRREITRIIEPGEAVAEGRIPFTPRSKKVLEMALREALSLNHNYIGTEHILLGLVRENEGVASRILLDLDADPEKIRGAILHMLSGPYEALPDWQPGLGWKEARVDWTAEGPVLVVPLRLERRAVELFDASAVWQRDALASVRHEVAGGVLRITAPSLLETVDPATLRELLDDALRQAHERAAATRARESALAEAFLAALREGTDA